MGPSGGFGEQETLEPGTELGRYRIVRLLGRCAMGVVYEAMHRDLKKRVAIKTLHPAVAAQPGARVRFLREGEAASRIRHPNVVDVTDVATEGSVSYLVMEFLEGEDLSALIAHSGPLPIARSVDLMLPVLAAIAVAHEEGVIHRDLKPENIFLESTRFGGVEPKVLDFDISKLTSSGGGNTLALTGTGASMGTPHYIAPEQVRSAAGVDARSDQYALGAILYECVTGHRAHQGETIYEVIRSVSEGAFPPPRARRTDVPPEVEAAILRAMSLDPARRFPSVRALGRALLPFASTQARGQWAQALASDDVPGVSSLQGKSWQPGGTVAFVARAPKIPRASPPLIPNTTFGGSAAQIMVPVRNRRGWLVGGVLAMAAAGIGAYVISSPTLLPQAHDPRPPGASAEPQSSAVAQDRPVAHYRVQVTASPRIASFDLDGRTLGRGPIDEQLPLDGADHTLTVTAAGFLPAKLNFRDHAPAEEVALEPAPVVAPQRAAEGRPVAEHSNRSPSRVHNHNADRDESSRRPRAAKPSGPVRSGNDAPIIDD